MSSIETFTQANSFAIAGAQVPAREAQALLATQVQLEAIEALLRQEVTTGPSLAELREPDLARVNYLETVRGVVSAKWRSLEETPASVPPPQLLGQLDHLWAEAEKTIGEEVQGKARQIFTDRAQRKAEIIEDEAVRQAVAHGLPAAVCWIQDRQRECEEARKPIGQEISRYAKRKEQQEKHLKDLKTDWSALLSSEEGELEGVARRVLLLTGGLLLAEFALWFFTIPTASVTGLLVFAAIALWTWWLLVQPLLRHLRWSRQLRVAAARLVSAYRSLSLYNLDEMTKRLELTYPEALSTHIDHLREACRQRIAQLEEQRVKMQEREKTLAATLRDAPPTISILLRDETLTQWYERGKAQAPIADWIRRLASLQQEPDWTAMEHEARQAFSFLQMVRVEDELYGLYPGKEERVAFLQTLREVAIGATPGEAFLALNAADTAGNPPQVYLIIEMNDPDHSPLAAEIRSEWAGDGVGVIVERTSDPTAITLIGLVHGFPLRAQREWETIETAFERISRKEGRGLYPVLFPEKGGNRHDSAGRSARAALPRRSLDGAAARPQTATDKQRRTGGNRQTTTLGPSRTRTGQFLSVRPRAKKAQRSRSAAQ